MAKVKVNNKTFTMVLDGAGFCISQAGIYYAFGDTVTDDDAFPLRPQDQVNGMAGKKLWAKSVTFEEADVVAVEE